METAVPEGLTVFLVPEAQRRRLRTTNALERVNREIRRRTRVATLFPNEASLLRLVSALGAEISEEWETGRVYLAPEPPRDSLPEGDARGCAESRDRQAGRTVGTPGKTVRHRNA
jgi:hypothetical protein